MKKLVSVFAAIMAVGIFALGARAQITWTTVTPENRNFTVSMPGEPKLDVKESTGNLGPYKTFLYTVSGPAGIFLVGWAEYAPNVRLDIPGELKANRDNFLKGVKGTLIDEKAVTLGGHPGIEFTADINNTHSVISRVYVAANRPYQVIAVTRKGADQTNVNKFLSSFAINVKK